MRILVDENISYRLLAKVSDLLPGLTCCENVGLCQSADQAIWTYAKENGFDAILTADIDFQNNVLELGPPPKVIRVHNLNFATDILAQLLRREAIRITEFLPSGSSLLVLRR